MKKKGRTNISEMDFKLERYKFINQEIHTLNLNVHKYLNDYQTITISIIVASVFVFTNYQPLKVPCEIAIISLKSLNYLLIGFSVFIFLRILAGIFSWFDYRKEEYRLLNKIISKGYRRKPDIKNFWRWDEFYTLIIVIIIPILFTIISNNYIIPNIN